MSSSSRSLLTINGIIVAGLVFGVLNNVLIAALFGLARPVDAYFAATTLPGLFMALVVDYLGRNFLPMFARAKKQSFDFASELTSSIVTIVFLIGLGVALIMVLLSRPLFTMLLPGFDGSEIELVRRYFMIMAPTIGFMAVTTFHERICQHDEKYIRLTAIRIALPLTNLVVLLAASRFIGEYALPVSYLLGNFIVFILMARHANYRYFPRMLFRRDWEIRVFTDSAVLMSSGLVSKAASLVTTYLASTLGSGAIAALSFASKFVEPVERTMLSGVTMMVFSRTARLFLENDRKEMARLYGLAVSASFLVLAPVLWWIGFNRTLIVETVLMRGQFDARMATLVSLALVGLLPRGVLGGVNPLVSNAFYVMERITVPALVNPLSAVIYIALAPPLAHRLGVLGLTMSTSVASTAVLLCMLILLSRAISEFRAPQVMLNIAGYVLLSGAAFALPYTALRSLELSGVSVAIASLASGLLIYIGVLALFRDRTFSYMWQYLRRAMPSRWSSQT